jgi:hypothetical protein
VLSVAQFVKAAVKQTGSRAVLACDSTRLHFASLSLAQLPRAPTDKLLCHWHELSKSVTIRSAI